MATFKKIINYNLEKAYPRNILKEKLIYFIQKKTGLASSEIDRKLNQVLSIGDTFARKQMIFTIFLIKDSQISKLIEMDYENSIPNNDDLQNILFEAVNYYDNIDSSSILEGLRMAFSFSVPFKPLNRKEISIDDITPYVKMAQTIKSEPNH